MVVWVYISPSKKGGDVDHLKVFASADAADDPEGVAFEYEVLEWTTSETIKKLPSLVKLT